MSGAMIIHQKITIEMLNVQLAAAHSKLAKQKNELARLTQHTQSLMSDKRQLVLEVRQARSIIRDALNDTDGWRERAIMEAGK